MRAHRRRSQSSESTRPSNSATWHIDQLRKELGRTSRALETVKATSRERLNKVDRLTRALADRERYIQEQAHRNAEANKRAAVLQFQLNRLREEHDARAGIDPAEVVQLRAHLEEGRNAYRELRKNYETVNNAIEGAVKEREGLQHVVRQWDRLCRRLSEQTNGRPRTERDQEILATWQAFRKQVGRHNTAITRE